MQRSVRDLRCVRKRQTHAQTARRSPTVSMAVCGTGTGVSNPPGRPRDGRGRKTGGLLTPRSISDVGYVCFRARHRTPCLLLFLSACKSSVWRDLRHQASRTPVHRPSASTDNLALQNCANHRSSSRPPSRRQQLDQRRAGQGGERRPRGRRDRVLRSAQHALMPTFPEWWNWDLSFTGHAELRIEQRGVTEVEVRAMLEKATGLRAQRRGGQIHDPRSPPAEPVDRDSRAGCGRRAARRRDCARGVRMTERSLQITYRKGRPFAAYLHLSHATGEKSAKTVATPDGLLVVDYNSAGQAVGVEITSPQAVPLDRLNELLATLGEAPLPEHDYRPLRAA